MNAPTLFDASVRGTDPDTSHDAAESMRGKPLSAQRSRVLEHVGFAGEYGATAYEIAQRTLYQQSVVARRLTDLHELGLIRDTGKRRPGGTGRPLIVWAVA